MPTYTTLKGISDIGLDTPLEMIKTNVSEFLKWGFVGKGGYTNVYIPQSGAYGGDFSKLRPVQHPNYTDGQVWAAARKDWVYESGVQRATEPIRVSGIEINGVFRFLSEADPTAINLISGYIDYPNGQIILDSPLATSSQVKASYSYRWIHTYNTSNNGWVNQIQHLSHRVDDSSFLGSGIWDRLAENSIQLPAVMIEFGGSRPLPYQLGGGFIYKSNIVFHVIAEDENTSQRIAFILSNQFDKSIFMFDTNEVSKSGVYPIDYRGMVTNQLQYPELVDQFRFRQLDLLGGEMQTTQYINQNTYITPVKVATELILAGI